MLVFFLFLEKLLHGICFLRNKELLGNNMNHLVPIRMPIVSSKIHLSIIANMLSIKGWRSQFLATSCWIQNGSFLDKNIIACVFTVRSQIRESWRKKIVQLKYVFQNILTMTFFKLFNDTNKLYFAIAVAKYNICFT